MLDDQTGRTSHRALNTVRPTNSLQVHFGCRLISTLPVACEGSKRLTVWLRDPHDLPSVPTNSEAINLSTGTRSSVR